MCSHEGKASPILIDYTWIVDDIPYSRSKKKTVTFSFCSVPWERKWNARSSGKKQSIPFPETVIEWWVAPQFSYSSITAWHCLAVKVQNVLYINSYGSMANLSDPDHISRQRNYSLSHLIRSRQDREATQG